MGKYCAICDEEVNAFNYHIKNYHHITMKEYRATYSKKYCILCNKEIIKYHYKVKFCSDACKKEFLNQKNIDKTKDIKNGITCIICGFIATGKLVSHINAKHNLSIDDYKALYDLKTEDCFSEE